MNLIIGNKYTCEAVEIRDYGAIMRMEDGSTSLLHISNISDSFVRNVSDYITVGDTYEVTAIRGRVKDVEITLRDPSHINYDADTSKKKEDNFEKMLEDYLPTDRDRQYKHDRGHDRRDSRKGRGNRR